MKSGLSRYEYLNAKLDARLANLRDSNVTGKLLEANSFVQALDALEGTSYANLADVYKKTGDLQMLEKALLEDQISMRQGVCRQLDGQSAVVSSFFLMKIEIDNLKNIIRIWYDANILGGSSGYRLNYILRTKIYSDVNWDEVINSPSWDALVSALKPTVYYQTISQFTVDDIRNDGLVFWEMKMDCWYYQSLENAVRKLGRQDRQVAAFVLDSDFDLKNILILIRYGLYYGIEPKKLYTLLLPGGPLYLNPQFHKCFEGTDYSKLKAFLLHHYPHLPLGEIFEVQEKTDLLAKSLSLEKVLLKERIHNYRKITQGDPFTIGLIMSYFFNYDHYDDSVRIILHGKFYSWPDDKIMEVLR